MTHRFAYPDTSLLIPLFVQETGTVVSRRILSEFTKGGKLPLIISELTCVEFASAVAKYVRMELLAKDVAERIFTAFSRQCEKRFIVLPMQPKIYSAARGYIMRLDTSLRTLDALHLAIAHANHCTLLTADRQFAAAAAMLDVEHCFTPFGRSL